MAPRGAEAKLVMVLAAERVWKRYPGSHGASAEALRGADLSVREGEVVALQGRSGSGKTTLLNLLAGLDTPSRGTIRVGGQDLGALGEMARTRFRRHHLGFVFQFFNLLPTLTALENVSLSLELAGRPDAALAQGALDAVSLGGKGSRFPHQLSGGEQQRVAIARAVVKDPAVILADEPTGNLDTATGDQVLTLLVERCRELGASLVMATHSPRVAARADRVVWMTDGTVSDRPGGLEVS